MKGGCPRLEPKQAVSLRLHHNGRCPDDTVGNQGCKEPKRSEDDASVRGKRDLVTRNLRRKPFRSAPETLCCQVLVVAIRDAREGGSVEECPRPNVPKPLQWVCQARTEKLARTRHGAIRQRFESGRYGLLSSDSSATRTSSDDQRNSLRKHFSLP